MKTQYFVCNVVEDKCTGDKLCENVCPTEAIRVTDKKAVVDDTRCVGCLKCFDVCEQGAVQIAPLSPPRILKVDFSGVDQRKVEEVCRRAHRDPEEEICLCTQTKAKEVAAAILKGAVTLQEIALASGVLCQCGTYCLGPVQQLMEACGIDPKKIPGRYHAEVALWNLPQEVIQKYPQYHLEEEIKLQEDNRSHHLVKSLKPRKRRLLPC